MINKLATHLILPEDIVIKSSYHILEVVFRNNEKSPWMIILYCSHSSMYNRWRSVYLYEKVVYITHTCHSSHACATDSWSYPINMIKQTSDISQSLNSRPICAVAKLQLQ